MAENVCKQNCVHYLKTKISQDRFLWRKYPSTRLDYVKIFNMNMVCGQVLKNARHLFTDLPISSKIDNPICCVDDVEHFSRTHDQTPSEIEENGSKLISIS